jgi:hypothetical protein
MRWWPARPGLRPGRRRAAISLAGPAYPIGVTFTGEHVEVVVTGGLVEILHHGCLSPATRSGYAPTSATGSTADSPARVQVHQRARGPPPGCISLGRNPKVPAHQLAHLRHMRLKQ